MIIKEALDFKTISPCHVLGKCMKNSMENLSTEVRV